MQMDKPHGIFVRTLGGNGKQQMKKLVGDETPKINVEYEGSDEEEGGAYFWRKGCPEAFTNLRSIESKKKIGGEVGRITIGSVGRLDATHLLGLLEAFMRHLDDVRPRNSFCLASCISYCWSKNSRGS
jgi:hypothetical protein